MQYFNSLLDTNSHKEYTKFTNTGLSPGPSHQGLNFRVDETPSDGLNVNVNGNQSKLGISLIEIMKRWSNRLLYLKMMKTDYNHVISVQLFTKHSIKT